MDDAETSQFGKAPSPDVLGRYLAELTGADAKVLLALAAHAGNAAAIAYPSRATLASMTGMPPGSVKRSLRRLEAAGAVLRLSTGTGRGHTSRYRIVLNAGGSTSTTKRDTGAPLSDKKGDTGAPLSDENRGAGAPVSDENWRAGAPLSDEKGCAGAPKGGHGRTLKRIEESKTTPPLTPPADSADDDPPAEQEGERAVFSKSLEARINVAWRQATGVGLSAADIAALAAETGNGSAELLPLVTCEVIRAADTWRRQRKFNVLNLAVVLMHLREKALERARADRAAGNGQAMRTGCLEAADAQRIAQYQQAAAKMAHFNSLPDDQRHAYLATARTKHPTAKTEAFIEGMAIAAAWAEYETSEDEVTV